MSISFVPIRRTLSVMAFIVGASFCFLGDAWHKQPSLFYLNQLPIPWWTYGIAFLLAGLLIPFDKFRPYGYLIGAIIYTIFSVAVWLAVVGGFHPHLFLFENFPEGSVSSFFAACNITTISVVYWVCLKFSIYRRYDPDNEVMQG